MKKGFFLTLFLVLVFIMPLGAQAKSTQSKYTSPFFYENIPVYQILNAQDAYIIIYAKYTGVGKVIIPKSWTKSSAENPAKLVFRNIPQTLNPYMTLIRKNGEFYKVYLTVPFNRSNSIWGKAPDGTKIDNLDKTTLDIEL